MEPPSPSAQSVALCRSEIISGYFLVFASILALVIANLTPYSQTYQEVIHRKISLLGQKPLSLMRVVNDFLITLFFLLLGLEMKYHLSYGEFRDKKKLLLPAVAACGGFTVPAIIYIVINWHSPETLKGWAIPIATDTAFMLATLSFFSNKISIELRAFIIGFSLIDDLIALLVLAIFYRQSSSITALALMAVPLLLLWLCYRYQLIKTPIYLFIGLFLWAAMVEAGINGTLSGAIIALAIPISHNNQLNMSFFKLQKVLRPVVFFVILPLFAFINAGVSFSIFSMELIHSPLALGIIAGLLVGKPFGIMLVMLLTLASTNTKLPDNMSLNKLYAIATLSGIGFTFSLFIGDLSFTAPQLNSEMRLSVIISSLAAAILGSTILAVSQKK